ncbi:hypothetical protein LEP1GSC021_5044 [Leptospira noguchii str. 1993005606]|uniref:Integrase core domain protein n=2 Tax=Leptospira noguchii TaxID=28182 RepID=M6YEK8_9LEPT|nr:hypothetical protein LEP1GSC035_4075 [Leptospira noguchii str. 2007001578]EMO88034.1 hypothetical protein LEP1GSC024_0302 [Leptospira noguchii str. 2001034031]EPE85193.1 hypothetical protein LEP1GSC021_5044 [Leptospira noguchii str. 1993005606]
MVALLVNSISRLVFLTFGAVAFRKKAYNSIEDLQKDLDQWIYSYNYERTH